MDAAFERTRRMTQFVAAQKPIAKCLATRPGSAQTSVTGASVAQCAPIT